MKLFQQIYTIFLLFFPITLVAQTQYEYYDDSEITGGADNVLNGTLTIILLTIIGFFLLIIANLFFKIYNWLFRNEQIQNKSELSGEHKESANCYKQPNLNQIEKTEVPISYVHPQKIDIVTQQKTSDTSTTSDKGYRDYIASFELTINPKSTDLKHNFYCLNMYEGDKLVSIFRGSGIKNMNYDINPKEGTTIICDNAYDDFNRSHAHTVSIPNSVIAIGDCAFMCLSLSEITIPSSVKYITGNPFSNRCKIIRCQSTRFSFENMCLLSKEQSLLIADMNENVKIKRTPDGIKYIGRGAYRSHYIQMMIISNSVVGIADNAFGSKDLFVIKFEGETEFVDNSIWEKCPNVKAIRIPKGTLEHYKIIIPKKFHEYISEIKQDEMLDGNFIHQLMRNEDKKKSNSLIEIYPKRYIVNVTKKEMNYIKKERKNYDLTICLESDWYNAIIVKDIYEEEKQRVTICEASYSADAKKFLKLKCEQHKDSKKSDYVVKRGTKVICDNSFKSAHNYTIKLPSSVNILGNKVFISAYKNTFVIPKSVKYITGNPFIRCQINLINESPNFVLEDGILYDKDKLKVISITKEVTDTSLFIPSPVTIIGRYSFYGLFYRNCSQIIMPSSVRYIEASAFEESCFSEIKFHDIISAIEIGQYAFAYSSIKHMFLPFSLKKLGKSAFIHCKDLETVSLSPNMEVIEKQTFSGCLKLNHLYIPEGIKILKRESFFMCTSLNDVYLPNSLEIIEDNTFSFCPLKYVVLSEKTVVCPNAFPSDCEIIYREVN